jgi:hypothetical protein
MVESEYPAQMDPMVGKRFQHFGEEVPEEGEVPWHAGVDHRRWHGPTRLVEAVCEQPDLARPRGHVPYKFWAVKKFIIKLKIYSKSKGYFAN